MILLGVREASGGPLAPAASRRDVSVLLEVRFRLAEEVAPGAALVERVEPEERQLPPLLLLPTITGSLSAPPPVALPAPAPPSEEEQ